jgi:hypothetical protein
VTSSERRDTSSSVNRASSSDGPSKSKRIRKYTDFDKQFQNNPTAGGCFRCGDNGHSKYSANAPCKDRPITCEYCMSSTHVVKTCRHLHSACHKCGYRGHKPESHLDANGKDNGLARDVEKDWARFRLFREKGYFTKKRETMPGFGFWLIPGDHAEKFRQVSHKVLYERGYKDAKTRIDGIVSGSLPCTRYTLAYRELSRKLPLPKELQGLEPKKKKKAEKKKKANRK